MLKLCRIMTLSPSAPASGCCAGQNVLPDGPVDAILGKSVTLKTLVDKPVYVFIIWNHNDGSEQTHVATASHTGVKVNEPYTGRVTVNQTNGYLHLEGLLASDNGDYSINIITEDGTTITGEIHLRVLGENTSGGILHVQIVISLFPLGF